MQKPVGERVPIRKAPGTSRALRSILSKILAQLGGQPGAPWGSKGGRRALAVGPALGLHLNETSENGLFFPGPFSLALLLFFSHFWRVLLKYLVLSNLVINLML